LLAFKQPERVAEVDRIAAGVAVEVEPAGEAEGIFLRKTPDRTCGRTAERRRCGLLFFLVARQSRVLVVKRALDPEVHFRGEWRCAASAAAW
jgi:hypothetical protein